MSKPKLSLFPKNALWLASEVLTEGEAKHPKFGWKNGSHTVTELLDKVLRHTTNFLDGQDFDEESGKLNLSHALADLALAVDVYTTRKDLDDRHKSENKGTAFTKVLNELEKCRPQSNIEPADYWNEITQETIALAKQMQEPRTVAIPDYDIDSDNNEDISKPMLLTRGMKLIHNDGQVIEVQTTGTFFVKKGSQITW